MADKNDITSTRTSTRRIKKKAIFDIEEPQKRQRRSCEKSGCNESEPNCSLQSSPSCCRDGYTSRWYHISFGEHFCNECFDYYYRPNKEGFPKFSKWSNDWFLAAQSKPTIKRFVVEEALPYWLKCTSPKCGKWREMRHSSEPSPSAIGNFKCELAYSNYFGNACDIVEESYVADTLKANWLGQLVEVPLLKKSPASPYLTAFYPEGIGLCPLECSNAQLIAPEWILPFNDALNGASTIWVRPDIMEVGEIEFIGNTLNSSAFLGLRNLIVTLWLMSPKEWVTVEKVSKFLICRGLIRIYLLRQVEKIIKYLTFKATINYGLVNPPVGFKLSSYPPTESVIVIGAGIAGLSAARYLHNLGVEVTVLEARSRIGGQICDDKFVGLGAQFIHGVVNNPLTILCHQANIKINILEEDIVFIKDNGDIIDDEVLQRMQHQYSGIMHGALEWAKETNQDANWFDTIVKHQEDFHQLATFSIEEDNIFDLYLKLDEVSKRANTKELTLFNYESPKSLGDEGYIHEGIFSLMDLLADSLNIKHNCKVNSVDYEDDEIHVGTDTETFTASKVLITVPVNLLRTDEIKFNPPLSEQNLIALRELGTDVFHEKLFLQFPRRFWHCILKGPLKKFAIVTSSSCAFQFFVDVTDFCKNKMPTLLTFITNCTKDLLKDKNDEEIVQVCMDALKKLFKKLNVKVPELTHWVLTHWFDDPYTRSCGNYVKVKSSFEIYDKLVKDLDRKVYFAGGSTFRSLPNSASGAYLSGLREASKIADSIIVL